MNMNQNFTSRVPPEVSDVHFVQRHAEALISIPALQKDQSDEAAA